VTTFGTACAISAGELLLFAAGAKSLTFRAFADYLSGFGLFAPEARIAARVVIGLEALVGISLLTATFAFVASIAAVVMSAVFGAVQAHQLAGTEETRCHCFGVLDRTGAGVWSAARAAVLLGLAAVAVFAARAGVEFGTLGAWSAGTAVAVATVLGTALAGARAYFDANRHRAVPAASA